MEQNKINEYNKNKIEKRLEFPWKYKCGHKSTGILLDDNEISILKYLEWKDTVGVDGDMSECFNCYIKRTQNNGEKEQFADGN